MAFKGLAVGTLNNSRNELLLRTITFGIQTRNTLAQYREVALTKYAAAQLLMAT
jgi:hypothetical protein